MSYNGIGLQTARGSGTNLVCVSPRTFHRSASRLQRQEWKDLKTIHGSGAQGRASRTGHPGARNRKREIEAKLMQLEDDLEERGASAEEIAEKLKEARARFERESGARRARGGRCAREIPSASRSAPPRRDSPRR